MSENNDAVKAAQAKIKTLTTRKAQRSVLRQATCTTLTKEVTLLKTYISQSPTSTKIKVNEMS